MKALPGNCRVGKIVIYPANWKSGGVALLKKKWYIKYRFYDDNLKQSKQVMLSNFNRYNTLEERRFALSEQLRVMDDELMNIGYNPITDKSLRPALIPDNEEISKRTPFISALNYAKSLIKVADNTMKGEVEWVIGQLEVSAKALKFDKVGIGDITLKHLFLICERASYKVDKSYSGDKFNRNKKVLRQLYKKLLIFDVVPSNLPLSLERQKGAPKKKKEVFTIDDRRKIAKYLEDYSPRFLLFLQVFFHSGSRTTELLRVKAKDVDLKGQKVNYLIMKGRQYEYKDRPIKNIALQYWEEAVRGAGKDDYIFSADLLPGKENINENVIKKRWQRMQKKIGIKGGMYQLKHSNTTETVGLIGTKAAAMQNAESEEMIMKHYDVDNQKRQDDIIKSVNNPFA